MRPTIVSVSGFGSNVGKTTVLCNLLKHNPRWEAIKITRGHYRSCGKNAEACCVSAILEDEPVVLSDRRDTDIAGKDTGCYWASGAAMVHWTICTDRQIEQGIKVALSRVSSEGVLIEGGSFLKYMDADYSIMVASPAIKEIKSSAIGVMKKMNALIINRSEPDESVIEEIKIRLSSRGVSLGGVPIYFERDLPVLSAEIESLHARRRSFLRGVQSVM